MGMGSEVAASVVSDVGDGEVEDLQHGVVGRERAPRFGDFAELVVQRLDGVGIRYDIAVCFGRLPIRVLGSVGRVRGVPEE